MKTDNHRCDICKVKREIRAGRRSRRICYPENQGRKCQHEGRTDAVKRNGVKRALDFVLGKQSFPLISGFAFALSVTLVSRPGGS